MKCEANFLLVLICDTLGAFFIDALMNNKDDNGFNEIYQLDSYN